MKKLLLFAAGVGVGYILGARAGRERYEQLRDTAQRFADRPAIHEAVGLARAKADELIAMCRDVATNSAAEPVSSAAPHAAARPADTRPAATPTSGAKTSTRRTSRAAGAPAPNKST